MGKVLKAVALIAIAAGIAYFAPGIGLAVLHAFGSTAVAGSLAAAAAATAVAAGLGIAASAALGAISPAPSGIRGPVMVMDASGMRWERQEPAPPEPAVLAPIEPRWWWAFFWPGQRYSITKVSGDCMAGALSPGGWGLFDREAEIRPGDLFLFDIDDMWRTYAPDLPWRWWHRLRSVGMVKRYLGQETEWSRVIFECTNPPTLCETDLRRVRYAYRMLSHHGTLWAAFRARTALRSN